MKLEDNEKQKKRNRFIVLISPTNSIILRQSWRKRHLIIFLEYFHGFLGLGHEKNFGKTLWQSRCFGIIIGQFRPLPPILSLCEIQKIWDFQYFWANLATFFFKIRFWTKLVLEPLKMFFLTLFRSWRWFISIFDPFVSFYVFFMSKSVDFASFDATWQ